MARRLLLAAVAVVVVVGIVAVAVRPGSSSSKLPTATVTKGSIASTVELAGSVAAHDTRTAAFAASGTVKTVAVAEGDVVAAGATIATLDDTIARAQLDAANAQLTAARAQLTAANAAVTSAQSSLTAAKSRLSADRSASAPKAVIDADTAQVRAAETQVASARAQVASATSQIAAAESQVAAAQLALDNATLTAPIAGTVVSLGFAVGDRVAAGGLGGAGTVVIADLTTLGIASTASEIDVVTLTSGMAVTVTFDALTDLSLDGTICDLGTVGTGTGGVVEFPLTVCLAKQDAGLRVGMSANVSITLAKADGALIVPAQAVRTVDGKQVVTVLGSDGTTSTVDVTVGISSGTRTQILSGLSEGQTVVLGDTGTGG